MLWLCYSTFWPEEWLYKIVPSAHCARSWHVGSAASRWCADQRVRLVVWFCPTREALPQRCCCQHLCCNCASLQHAGICWIQGGVFSIRAQWNTFSASLVAWWATAKGGSRQYNDAWHKNATVLQPVPRKPHNMCHCVPCFAAWPRCLALAGHTESPGCTVMLIAAGL